MWYIENSIDFSRKLVYHALFKQWFSYATMQLYFDIFQCVGSFRVPQVYVDIVLGKSKSGFLNPKTDFAFFEVKSKNASWIHNIHTLGGFFRSKSDFWDSPYLSIFEKSIFDKRFSVQKWYTTVTVRDVLADHPVRDIFISRRFLCKFYGKDYMKKVLYRNCKHLSCS